MSGQPLLLISRRDLLDASESAQGDRLIRALAALTRRGFHFVATASQPEDWSRSKAESKRRHSEPKKLRKKLAEAGGVMDGVYYIPHSLLTQRARRNEAIRDLLERFGAQADACYLLSSNKKLLAAAESLGVNTKHINETNILCSYLELLVETANTS